MKKYFYLPAALIFALSLAACFNQTPPSSETNQNTAPEVQIPASSINLAKPLEISNKPEDVALAGKINDLIEKSEFSGARWGVFVVSLTDGRVVAARDAQKLFTPASALKIITSVVALDKLGADFRWKTRVFAKESIANGTLDGNLILYGEGAPDLSEEGIQNLVNQLKAKGLQKVKGDVVGDESYFTGDKIGDGWAWNELQWYYGAEASALSINRNLVNVSLQEDGKPKAEPATDYVEFSGAVAALQNGDAESIGLQRGLGNNKIYVWGEGKNLDVRVAVENPALWSAKIFREALTKNGIAVEGAAKSADWKSENKFNPENVEPLANVDSQTLGEIVRRMNKDSVNLYAELILRTLGKKFGAEAPDENQKTRKTRGDDAAGAAVLKKWLADSGGNVQETESIKDGSGLSRLNFVTPETIGRALLAGNQLKSAEIFTNSLPIAGADGTLRGRLGNAAGRISAKTGSIMFVNSLAGYARRKDETLAFVILCNNETRKADSSVLIDAIAISLLEN